jgi:hypothetical protein
MLYVGIQEEEWMKVVASVAVILLCITVVYPNTIESDDQEKTEAVKKNIFSLSLGMGIRNVSEDRSKDVYRKNNLSFNMDIGFRLIRVLELFLHTDYLSIKGELTYTKEETKLSIIPIELGVRGLYRLGRFCPSIGGGAGYYFYKEENPIGEVKDNKLGFFIEGGTRFYISKSLFLGLTLKYIFLKVPGTESDVNLGGLLIISAIGLYL